MTTPPPPIAAPLQPGAEPTQPGLSQAARLINIFIAPRKTFEDLRLNASWWVPFLLGAVISLAFGIVAVQKIDLVRLTRQQIEQNKFAQRQIEQLPPEQQERAYQQGATRSKFAFYLSPVIGFIGSLICAGVLMGVFNFGFAAEIPFKRALAIVFYSFFPRALYAVLLAISLLVASDPNAIDIAGNPMPTNPGFFMDPQGNKFIYSLASNLDIMALWTVILLGLGFSAASTNKKLSSGTTIATMCVIYGGLILIIAGLKVAFS
jgi:Yip1 domain